MICPCDGGVGVITKNKCFVILIVGVMTVKLVVFSTVTMRHKGKSNKSEDELDFALYC